MNKKTHKYKTHKKQKKTKKQIKKSFKGGSIYEHNIFSNINSIGFEIETLDLIKLTKFKNKLINSSLANGDLEYGYTSDLDTLNEYVNIETNDKNISFKITNDSADDSLFNEEITELNKNVDCLKDVLFLNVTEKNDYLTENEYSININEGHNIVTCSTFTDTEWVLTYYNPIKSKNIIMNYFIDSYKKLKNHLNNLVKIKANMFYINKQSKKKMFEKTFNEVYVLPNTNLVYMNSIMNSNLTEYNILKNLKVVYQMTFSCNILYIIKIITQLLSFSQNQLDTLINYRKEIIDKFDIESDYNIEYNVIYTVNEVTNKLFTTYNSSNNTYLFTIQNDVLTKIKLYFKLIFYKIYCYLNFYLKFYEENQSFLFKKALTFTVRHYNYDIYVRIKELMIEYFKENLIKLDKYQVNDKIIEIITKLLETKINGNNITDELYNDKTILKLKNIKLDNENYESLQEENYGDPFYSISNYFSYFENNNKNDDTTSDDSDETDPQIPDWLENAGIDTTSTKFPLENDNLIVEFRDFPNQLMLNIFINGNDYIRDELFKTNDVSITLNIIDEFIKINNL